MTIDVLEGACGISPQPILMETKRSHVEKLTYTTKEAAIALGLSEMTIYRLLQRRKLHALPDLRHKIIPRKEIERFLNTARN